MKIKRALSFIIALVLCLSAFYVAVDTIKVSGAASAYTDYFNNVQSSAYSTHDIVINTENIALEKNSKTSFEFIAVQSALYNIGFCYTTLSDNSDKLELKLLLDDEVLFSEAENINLKRYYVDDGNVRLDALGNEVHANVKEAYGEYNYILKDDNNTKECLIFIEEGTHTLTLEGISGSVKLSKIVLGAPLELVSYKEYISKKTADYTGNQIVLEAENETVTKKTNTKIVGMTEKSSANVSPSSYKRDKVNYTGGTNWSQPGDSLFWKINVEQSGYYNIAVNYRQHYTQNTTFYRELRIDGKVPFEEAKNIAFPYARNWTVMSLGDGKKAYKFYFEAGKEYELELSVTLGPLNVLCEELDRVTSDIASLYRNIIMVTGDTIDSNRDYNLFNVVDNWDERLNDSISSLENISSAAKKIMGSSGSSTISTINNLVYVLKQMRDNKYSAHKQVDSLYTYYASLCSLLGELREMPLDIDRFILSAPDSEISGIKAGFFESVFFGLNKFIWSFTEDYEKIETPENREKIAIWVNWGRDQAKVLQFLTQSDFSVKNNIDVDIKITNATLTHAMLSGNGPDLMLNLSRSEPVNLAMRDALYDLTNFDGTGEYSALPKYTDIIKSFSSTATTPYWFERNGHSGLYALPDTQTFFMMFIREDIFNEMGLSVPKTWEEFDKVAVSLLRNNMIVGLPYTQITAMEQVNVGAGALSIFPTLLIQKNESLYNNEYTATNMLTEETINTFKKWTNYYLKFGFPQTYDFFNRFRVGLMPMAIQAYTNYATLSAAAPEISGLWQMYEIPGEKLSDGTVDNRASGGGTGAGILATSKNKVAAWKFITWWVSEETQYQYCTEVESILGPSARVATSNVEALKRFDWNGNNLDTLLSQWKKVEEIPEVPGGYSVARIIDQSFWNTINNGEDSQDMLIKWSKIADSIINRKRSQYGLSTKGDS